MGLCFNMVGKVADTLRQGRNQINMYHVIWSVKDVVDEAN